jgi:hypothetical protein
MIENTTVSRHSPSAERMWLRSTPSCFAPRRAIAFLEAWLNQLVRNSTAAHCRVSKACRSSSSFASLLSAVRCTRFAYQVQPTSTRRLSASTLP